MIIKIDNAPFAHISNNSLYPSLSFSIYICSKYILLYNSRLDNIPRILTTTFELRTWEHIAKFFNLVQKFYILDSGYSIGNTNKFEFVEILSKFQYLSLYEILNFSRN